MTFYAENATRQDAIDYAIKHGFSYVRSYACDGWTRWKVTNEFNSNGVLEWTKFAGIKTNE